MEALGDEAEAPFSLPQVRDDEEWQEGAQALFQGGVISISARKNGTIFEVWFG